MCGSALAVSFMSMTGFRTFVHSYSGVPGSQMAVIIVKPTARDVHWRRHDISLSSDTQFWESRGTNRKTEELIVSLCGSAIHWQPSLCPFNLGEGTKRKMRQSFTDKAPDPPVLWGHKVWGMWGQPGPGLGGTGCLACVGVSDSHLPGVSWGCVIPSVLEAWAATVITEWPSPRCP